MIEYTQTKNVTAREVNTKLVNGSNGWLSPCFLAALRQSARLDRLTLWVRDLTTVRTILSFLHERAATFKEVYCQ